MIKYTAKIVLRIFGWKLVNTTHEVDKCVIIGVPHTSNWDMPIGLLCLAGLGLKFRWAAKDSIFIGPFKWVFKSIGGIPVNRKAPKGFLKEIAEYFSSNDKMKLAIAPEGTRKKTDYWKPGFYHIAMTAKVPILLGFLDASTKTTGVGDILYPSGNLPEDFKKIAEFYKDKTGINDTNKSLLQIK